MLFKSEYKTQMDYIYGGELIDFVFLYLLKEGRP